MVVNFAVTCFEVMAENELSCNKLTPFNILSNTFLSLRVFVSYKSDLRPDVFWCEATAAQWTGGSAEAD